MKSSKQKRITASLFCEILNGKAPRPKEHILVIGDVELPRHVKTLPPNVTFNDGLIVEKTNLQEFNHAVHGSGFFRCNRQLRNLGPKTSFGALDMEGCPIQEFNVRVAGDVFFSENMRTLKVFGPQAFFGRELDARGTNLRVFNHVVLGGATFTGLRTLHTIGPVAQFGGDVYIGGTSIREFNASVKGSLIAIYGDGTCEEINRKAYHRYFGARCLEMIGANTVIGGNLDVRCSPVKEFHGNVQGDANFSHTYITKLSDNACIHGEATLSEGVFKDAFLIG